MTDTPSALGTSLDNPWPFPHVLPKERLKPGEVYVGWLCKGEECESLIAIDPTAPASDRMLDDRFVRVTCPHCQAVDIRTWGGRAEHRYGTRAPISPRCPHCRALQMFSGYTAEELRTLLTQGGSIDGLCGDCGRDISAASQERKSIAKALGMSSWR